MFKIRFWIFTTMQTFPTPTEISGDLTNEIVWRFWRKSVSRSIFTFLYAQSHLLKTYALMLLNEPKLSPLILNLLLKCTSWTRKTDAHTYGAHNTWTVSKFVDSYLYSHTTNYNDCSTHLPTYLLTQLRWPILIVCVNGCEFNRYTWKQRD